MYLKIKQVFLWEVASWPDIVRMVSCVDFTTVVDQDDIRSDRKIILPPSFIGSWRYLHQDFQNAITVARQYHKPDLFITFTCNLHWPEATHSILPNQQPQDRWDGTFNLLPSKLCDKCVPLVEPFLFLNMTDIGTLHLYQHHLLLVLLVPKTPYGSKMPMCILSVYVTRFSSTNIPATLTRRQRWWWQWEDSDYIFM